MILGGFLVVWGLACAAAAFPYGLVPGVVLVFLGVMRLTADQRKKRKAQKAKEKARVKFEREQKAREDKLNTMRVFEDASDLPDDEGLLRSLLFKLKKEKDNKRYFLAAEKFYEVTGDPSFLSECLWGGIGTAKDAERGRRLLMDFRAEKILKESGSRLSTWWDEWWYHSITDLDAMLIIARDCCRNKMPCGIAMMEEVQLAIIGGKATVEPADLNWWKCLGLEPHAVMRVGQDARMKYARRKQIVEEMVGKNCWLALDVACQLDRDKYGLLLDEANAAAKKRLEDPERVEQEVRAWAEGVWRTVRQFEDGKAAISAGNEVDGLKLVEQAAEAGNANAELWLLEYKAGKLDGEALIELARAYETGRFTLEINSIKAEDLYTRAAEQGHPIGQYRDAIGMEKRGAPNGKTEAAWRGFYASGKQGYILSIANCARLAAQRGKPAEIRAADELLEPLRDRGVAFSTEERAELRRALIARIDYYLDNAWRDLHSWVPQDLAPYNRSNPVRKPDAHAGICYRDALWYVRLEAADVREGTLDIRAYGRGYGEPEGTPEQIEQNHSNKNIRDWYAAHDPATWQENLKEAIEIVGRFRRAMHKHALSWYRQNMVDESVGSSYSHDFRMKRAKERVEAMYKEYRDLYAWDLVRGAILQFAVWQHWSAAEKSDVGACKKICGLLSNLSEASQLVIEHFALIADRTGTWEGRQVAIVYTRWYDKTGSGSGGGSSAGSSRKKDDDGETSGGFFGQTVFDLPSRIHGPYGNMYVQISISSDSADYQCEETREIVTICNDDISGTRASTSEGLFWW